MMTDTKTEDHNVELIWKRQFLDGWLNGKKAEEQTGFYVREDCVLCGENTFASEPDGDPDGPAAFIHLIDHQTLLTVCTHCADRADDGDDLLDRCEVVVTGGKRRSN
jgi:hypothetical protein